MSRNPCYHGGFGEGNADFMSREDFTYLLRHLAKGALILNKL
jgi:hypothetical protein